MTDSHLTKRTWPERVMVGIVVAMLIVAAIGGVMMLIGSEVPR